MTIWETARRSNSHQNTFRIGWEVEACVNAENACCTMIYCNLPVYADTRCRRHTELPAKWHILRMQQTAGTHWETLSLRRRDKDREETGTHKHNSISAFHVTLILLRLLALKVWLRWLTFWRIKCDKVTKKLHCRYIWEQHMLPVPIHACHLAPFISKTERKKFKQCRGNDIKTLKQPLSHVPCMYQRETCTCQEEMISLGQKPCNYQPPFAFFSISKILLKLCSLLDSYFFPPQSFLLSSILLSVTASH